MHRCTVDKSAHSKQQTADSRQQAAGSRQQTVNSKQQAADMHRMKLMCTPMRLCTAAQTTHSRMPNLTDAHVG